MKGNDAIGESYETNANNDDEHSPLWFIMDEFGSSIRHSDDPTVAVAFIFYVPLGCSFSMMWPLKDVDYGGVFFQLRAIIHFRSLFKNQTKTNVSKF